MMFIGVIFSIVAVGFLCWLLFTLAVFALPFFAGVAVGIWAYHTGASWFGGIVAGAVAAGLIFGIGQLLLIVVRPLWLRIATTLVFVTPAGLAGYHATHGIVKHTMPSETWQIVFSIVGAVAVGITALTRMMAMAAPGPTGQDMTRG